MKRRHPLALRVAATLLPLTLVGALVAAAGGAGAGAVGCNGVCRGTLSGCPVVTPPSAGLIVRPSATSGLCSLASETLTLSNTTPYKVTLTSAFFAEPGMMLIEAGMVVNTIVVNANSTTEVVGTPNGVVATTAALSGTIAGAPIEITVTLAPDGGSLRCVVEPDGAVVTEDAAADTGTLLLAPDTGKTGAPDVGTMGMRETSTPEPGTHATHDSGASGIRDAALESEAGG